MQELEATVYADKPVPFKSFSSV